MMNKNAVICFCKHPEAGLVKSRLAKDIGDNNASKIYRALLENIINEICGHTFDVLLYCYPDSNHPILQSYASNYSLSIHNQQGKDLGEKMFHAMNNNLDNYKKVVLVGSDCLQINANYILKAFNLMNQGCDVVLGPSEDGGYALIGAKLIDESIFQDIRWSTANVLRQTLEKLTQLNLQYACLSTVRDLDTLEDYHYFRTHKEFMHLF